MSNSKPIEDQIKATTIRSNPKTANFPLYRAYLKIKPQWDKPYTRTLGPHRPNREDALDDAERLRRDFIKINQLP